LPLLFKEREIWPVDIYQKNRKNYCCHQISDFKEKRTKFDLSLQPPSQTSVWI